MGRHRGGKDISASLGQGTIDAATTLGGTQGGVAMELTSEATLKIITSKTAPIELKLTPIDMTNPATTASLQQTPGVFIENADQAEAYVAKLKNLHQEMNAHLKRKETHQAEQKKLLESERFASSDLSDDAYKIFLTAEFEIQKNDALGKFVVADKLFDSVEEALKHADGIYRSSEK